MNVHIDDVFLLLLAVQTESGVSGVEERMAPGSDPIGTPVPSSSKVVNRTPSWISGVLAQMKPTAAEERASAAVTSFFEKLTANSSLSSESEVQRTNMQISGVDIAAQIASLSAALSTLPQTEELAETRREISNKIVYLTKTLK